MTYRAKGGYFLAKVVLDLPTKVLGFNLTTTTNQLMEMGSNLTVARGNVSCLLLFAKVLRW